MSITEEAHLFFEKASKSFDAAATLLRDGHAEFAASRVYYGCFYVAEALLLTERLSFSRHSSVIAAYGRLFAKTERLDRRFHRLLQRTFVARHSADYDTRVDLDSTEVAGWIEEAREFLGEARSYIDLAAAEGNSPENEQG